LNQITQRAASAAPQALGLSLALLSGVVAGRASAVGLSLPAAPVRFTIFNGANSLVDVVFSEVPGGFRVTNGAYRGWCVDYETLIGPGPDFHATLFDSYGTNLPPVLSTSAWGRVNYLLNHRQGSVADVQNAIWVSLNQSFEPPLSPVSLALVAEAEQFGDSFVPTNGQVTGVLIVPQEPVQRLICELPVAADGAPTNPPGVIALSGPAVLPAGALRFVLSGQAGRTYLIEGTTNFVDWQPVGTVFNTNGTVEFRDSHAPAARSKFYRARLQ
jgi:hypothetical protein